MGIAHNPDKVKLFIAIMYAPTFSIELCSQLLQKHFGESDLTYGPLQFVFTNYYEKEMGPDLQKIYVTYKRLFDPGELASIKLLTNSIESNFALNGKRIVNIDPGYVSRDKLVLASTKNFYHRIYIGKGIYAEVTLHYRKGKYRHFSWTYPDYRTEGIEKFLLNARTHLSQSANKIINDEIM